MSLNFCNAAANIYSSFLLRPILAGVVVLADLEIPFELRQMLDIFKLYEVKSQWDEGSGDV